MKKVLLSTLASLWLASNAATYMVVEKTDGTVEEFNVEDVAQVSYKTYVIEGEGSIEGIFKMLTNNKNVVRVGDESLYFRVDNTVCKFDFLNTKMIVGSTQYIDCLTPDSANIAFPLLVDENFSEQGGLDPEYDNAYIDGQYVVLETRKTDDYNMLGFSIKEWENLLKNSLFYDSVVDF